jgi:hypothetical protein
VRRLASSLAGSVGRARPWPRRMVRAASLLLPRGAVRDRYRSEFVADLDGLTPGAQLRYAVGVLASAVALRGAAKGATSTPLEDTMTTTKPLLCRTNLHHRWEHAFGDTGEVYVRCRRCHKEKWTGLRGDRSVSANAIASYGSMN